MEASGRDICAGCPADLLHEAGKSFVYAIALDSLMAYLMRGLIRYQDRYKASFPVVSRWSIFP